jgi:hypothetical protein
MGKKPNVLSSSHEPIQYLVARGALDSYSVYEDVPFHIPYTGHRLPELDLFGILRGFR